MFSKLKIGIDLGTTNILIYAQDKGIVLSEPAIVAIDIQTRDIVAIGHEAKEMVGKTPKNIVATRPLQDGVIADFELTSQLLKLLLKAASKIIGASIGKPTVVVCVPSNSTSVEQRAIHNAVANFGVRKVHLIEEPVAAALGAELPVNEPISSSIVDIGGGTSEIGIISYGGVVSSHAVPIGGNKMDEAIIQYIRDHYQMLIGERTAEQIKCTIGHALPEHEQKTMDIRGRDRVTGLPKNITITSTETYHAIQHSLEQILEAIRATLENCPPELSGDIVDHGLTLTGGGALLNGIQEWLKNTLHIPIHIAPNPLESVAVGTGKALSMIQELHTISK